MVKKKREPTGGGGGGGDSSSDGPAAVCNHIKKAVDPGKLRRALKGRAFRTDCLKCEALPALTGPEPEPEPLWSCLSCGVQLCGRERNDHALRHYETPHSEAHPLAVRVSSSGTTVYCHSCRREVEPTQSAKLGDCVDQVRKWGSSARDSESPETRLAIPLRAPSPPDDGLRSPGPSSSSSGSSTRRVRGLTNLGNTCFFNSVMQCLAQTPHLVAALKEMSRPGEKFTFEGGKVKVPPPPPPPPPPPEDGEEEPEPQEEREIEAPPVSGELEKWGPITELLAEALQEIRSSGRSDVFTPRKLFNSFVSKVPHFGGGDQHDSHELLRHLLEAVRSEDLRRYQSVILQKLGLDSKEKRKDIPEETKQTIKFYGQQASDSILRPGQVFRGMLVSTLECQDCRHASHTTEHFLDLSLPITADKPQPPAMVRRKMQEEQNGSTDGTYDKLLREKVMTKKEKHAARKMRKNKKGTNDGQFAKCEENNQSEESRDNKSENKSSSEQSDADVEDNVEEVVLDHKSGGGLVYRPQRDNIVSYCMESGYNSEKVISSDSIRASPVADEYKEKGDASPERTDKDIEESKFASAVSLPYKNFGNGESLRRSNPDSGVASPETSKNVLSDVMNMESPMTAKELGSPISLSSEINMDMSSPRQSNNSPALNENEQQEGIYSMIVNLNMNDGQNLMDFNSSDKNNETEYEKKSENVITSNSLNFDDSNFDQTDNKYTPLYSPDLAHNSYDNPPYNSNGYDLNGPPRLTSPDSDSPKLKKDISPFARSNALSQRSLSDEGEYSIQSCLNQFTSAELLTGNNKVGCEACTKRADNGKTVYTNATKKFHISSTPAVLILHLKRFQLGPRNILRKITKHVNFPLVLDLAPFCADKTKNSPPNQNKMLYSLYGVVEHSGSTLHLGHYVAYVKVRPDVHPNDPRWDFFPGNKNKKDQKGTELLNGSCNTNDNESDSSLSGYESGEGAIGGSDVEPPSGKWYYISDSRVSETTEEKVLKVQAYLLFYERVL